MSMNEYGDWGNSCGSDVVIIFFYFGRDGAIMLPCPTSNGFKSILVPISVSCLRQ